MTTAAMDIGQKELPAGWKWVKLGDVVQTQSGGTPRRGVEKYWGGQIKWAKIKDITQSGKYITDTEETITKEAVSETSTQVFPIDTVLFAMYGSIGESSIVKSPIATNQAILGCRCGDDILPEFLWSWFCLNKSNLLRMGRGGTQDNLNAGIVRALDFPLPPLGEQKRIAGILNEQMAAVEEAKKAAQERLEAAKALPAAYLREVFPSSEDELPAGWEWVKLGDVCEQLKPGDLHSLKSVSAKGSIPVVSQSETGFIGYHDGPPGVHASADEPVVTFANHTCAVRVHTYPFSTIQNVFPFRPKANAHIAFVYWLLIGRVPVTFWGGHMPALRKTNLPLPPLEEQSVLAAYLDDTIAGVKLAEAPIQQELDTIEAMPAAFLRQAFSGAL